MDLFEENELNIASLYLIYAQKIPQEYNFWINLSNEEISHSKSIKGEKDTSTTIVENNFSRGVVKHVMDFVLKEIEKATQNKITHHEALLTALRIERSMLEKKCFEIFIPTNKKVKDMLCKLNKETEQHVALLIKEMKKNKFVF
jgi:hypothetical protein